MQTCSSISHVQKAVKQLHSDKGNVGFVPTMGALHEGHLSLIERSRKENDLTIASIFVNPIQFNNKKDLQLYPRPIEQDLKLLESTGCDIVFTPSVEELYADAPVVKMNFGLLEKVMEGKYREDHFNGVGIIVSKLFNIIRPSRAYFGQKDLQQLTIIQQMVKDLSFGIEIIGCPVVRESNGLAMSSRNIRIKSEHKIFSGFIYESLNQTKELLYNKTVEEARQEIKSSFSSKPAFQLEYLEVVTLKDLQPAESLKDGQSYGICIAAYLGEVRLIDNIIFTY